jgi:hypothetical protein
MALSAPPARTVAAVFIAIAAVGCSSGSHQAQVAAVPASTAGAESPSASASIGAATSSRPRERLDEGTSQIEALYASWNQCLAAHGAGKGARVAQAVETAAQAACAHLQPLPPWQYDPANPKALGFVQQVVACLHQHGVKYAQVQNPPGQGRIEIALGGPQNDQASITGGLQLIPTCDQQVLHENAGNGTSP